MKTIYLLLLSPLLLAGCAKKGCTDSNASNHNVEAQKNDGSCEYLGCTDMEADNYNSFAKTDNGSCTYSWQKYVSTYNVKGFCDYAPDDHVSVVSKGPTSKDIVISNFDNRGLDMRATIAGNEFTFSDILDGVGYIGSGYIVDGIITINYSACEDYNYPDECDESTCQLKYTPQ